MFFDAANRPLYPGKVVKELVFDPINDAALPSWLTPIGVSPVQTFGTAAASQGYARSQTKSSSPAIGDQCGFQTAFNVQTTAFEEISFIAYGVLTDSVAWDCELKLGFDNGTNGAYWKNTIDTVGNTNKSYTRVYPSTDVESPWTLMRGGESSKRKDMAITYRRKTKEVFFTAGDPYEGGGVIAYNKGSFVDFTGQPFKLSLTTIAAAQRWLQVEKLKARFVSF